MVDLTIVTEFYAPNLVGGAEVQAMRRAEGLAKIGLKVKVICFDSNSGIIEETRNGVKVVRYQLQTHKAKLLSMLLPATKALIKHEKETEIYHVYNIYPLAGSGLYKLMGGKRPVVASLDNTGSYCPISEGNCDPCNLVNRYSCLKDQAKSFTERLACFPYAGVYPFLTLLTRQVDKYIAASQYIKQEYLKYQFSCNKLIVIPNSIDINSWQNATRKAHKGINIIYVGRMVLGKYVDILIKAFHKLSTKHPDTKLILVGDGPLFDENRSLVKQLDIENKVLFTGYLKQDEIKYYYSISDLFVYPSETESFGITLLEAMAYDIPSLVSDRGALKDVVKDAGMTFRMEVEDLASKMCLLIDQPDRLLALRNKCKDVLGEYADDKVLKDLVNVYEDILYNGK